MPQIQTTARLKKVLRAVMDARFNAHYMRRHPHPYKFVADMMGLLEEEEVEVLRRHVAGCDRCAGPIAVVNAVLDQAEVLDMLEVSPTVLPPRCDHGNFFPVN